MKYFMVIDGQRKGPFGAEELPAHGLERDTLVWCSGQLDWVRADQMLALREVILTIPPPVPDQPAREEAREAPEYTPSSFQTLHLWFAGLIGGTFLLPVFGALTLLAAQSETRQVAYAGPGGRVYTYQRYTDLGEVLLGVGGVLIGSSVLPLIAAVAIFAVLLYKVWNLIQDGHARTTPEKAVGFLFIPGFNFYWSFVAVYGLVLDLARYPRRHGGPYDMALPSTGLALALCILFPCTFVPFLNAVTILPLIVVWFLLTTALKNAAVALVRQRQPLPLHLADEAEPGPYAITRHPAGAEAPGA
jgi:hypothetical protein